MTMLRCPILLSLLTIASALAVARTPIRGVQQADAERMYQYVSARNPAFTREIAEAFYEIGETYGIRGDIALCQAVIETGWFRYDNGTAVPSFSHNYCGLGVRRRGDIGCSFSSVHDGVTAMIQHLYAYACRDPLPEGERLIDPRFNYVKRGSATSWESLSGKWAMNRNYGRDILAIYNSMLRHDVSTFDIEVIEVEIPDHVFLDEDTLQAY